MTSREDRQLAPLKPRQRSGRPALIECFQPGAPITNAAETNNVARFHFACLPHTEPVDQAKKGAAGGLSPDSQTSTNPTAVQTAQLEIPLDTPPTPRIDKAVAR